MDVLALLTDLGPATSVATLKESFPEMSRSELEDMLRRFRRVWRKRYRRNGFVLRWTRPGTVWAMDYTETPPIDGVEQYLLAVRDLSSGQQLLAWPTESSTAEETVAALGLLFSRDGAPLVMKMDNGPPFIAELTQEFLTRHGVFCLCSPPYTPQYNGSIEAGIGSLKSRIERRAAWLGHPETWSREDGEAARQEANALTRPWGCLGPTPDERWKNRERITKESRDQFQVLVEHHRNQAQKEEGKATSEELTEKEARRIDRIAIRRALVDHGDLLFRRRSIPLDIKTLKTAEIT